MPVAVKRYFNTMAGAPVVNGIAGTVVAWLNAILVEGFNPKVPASLMRVAGLGTALCVAHGYEVGDVVVLGGANEAVWNDEFRIVSVTTDTFSFAIAPDAPTPATGTFAARIAPLGWSRVYTDAQKAVYQPALPYARNMYRVLDDATVPTSANGRWAKIRGYEEMTDIDTGVGLFPTVAQVANSLSINKSNTADATARPWWAIGDSGIVYLGICWHATYVTLAAVTVMGDSGSLRIGDAYSSLLIGTVSDALPTMPGSSNNFPTFGAYNATQTGKYYARTHTQIGAAIALGMIGDNAISTSMGNAGLAYPHPPNNGLLLAPVGTVESSIVRCRALPGLYQPLHVAPLANRDLVSDLIDLPNRTLIAFDIAVSSVQGQALFDMTGPWR